MNERGGKSATRNLFRYDPVLGYRFIPNLGCRVRHEGGGYLVRSNSAGFRSGYEFGAARNGGAKRVLVFGDSNTAGDGVSNGKRFSDLLEAELGDVEVYNFGLPSSGVDQQYLTFREAAMEIEHDLVLLCPMVDNIRRNLQDARLVLSGYSGEMALLPKPYFEMLEGELVLRNNPVPKGHVPIDEGRVVDAGTYIRPGRSAARVAMGKVNTAVPALRPLAHRLRRVALPRDYNQASNEGWVLMDAILQRWVTEAASPIVLCPIPMFDHIYGNLRADNYRHRFLEFSARNDSVTFVDVLDDLSAAHEAGVELRFATDAHFTVAGHAAIARSMAPALEVALDDRSVKGDPSPDR